MERSLSAQNVLRLPKGYATLIAAQPVGAGAELVTIETDLSQGLHTFSIVGLPDKAIEESKDRISAAIRNSGFKSPKSTNRRIVLSLSPADLRKEGSHYDLPLAICYLIAAGEITLPEPPHLFIGELGLNGTLRPTRGVLPQVMAALKAGIRAAFVPPENAHEASLCPGMTVYAPQTLREIIDHLTSYALLSPYIQTKQRRTLKPTIDLAEIKGQESAKRAIEIAAAGRHNIMLYGPPGTGKTMLARTLPGILPSLTRTEVLEVTAIHSTAGILKEMESMYWPPFRSPHHTISATALIGGGAFPRAGEVTLAHRGILFLDEFAEFDSRSLESLRQPLEDKLVTISRTKGSLSFPADCMIVGALNPADTLTANPEVAVRAALKQARKISRPIADRIDLWVEVPHIPYETLGESTSSEQSAVVRERVTRAHNAARIRKKNTSLDSSKDPVPSATRSILTEAARRLDLSPRAYTRTLRVARTIADLRSSETISETDVLEALQYRPRGMFGFQ